MSAESVTVCITRSVRPGCKADFERALHEFVRRSLIPGCTKNTTDTFR